MTEYCVVCIDDEISTGSPRDNAINLLSERDFLKVLKLHPTKVIDWLKDKELEPDMFVVDFRLNASALDGETFPFKGTSLVGMIRDVFPQVPVYLLSAFFEDKHSAKEVDIFDRLITENNFLQPGFILSDVRDFDGIKNSIPGGIQNLLALLRSPESSVDDLRNVLPRDFTSDLEDETVEIEGLETESTFEFSGIVRFGRWVQRPLLADEGILCGDVHASVLLGMDIGYFMNDFLPSEEGAKFVQQTKYTGIFSDTSKRRWWKQAIFNYIYSHPNSQGEIVDELPTSSPTILNVPEEQRAKCIVCREAFPQVVGSTDGLELYPVHRSCSELDPKAQVLPFFDHPRLIEG